jgi:hypothetical protein
LSLDAGDRLAPRAGQRDEIEDVLEQPHVKTVENGRHRDDGVRILELGDKG